MAQNFSGFGGYHAASIYPDMGSKVSDVMTTIVDPAEQESMSAIEPDKTVSPAVNPEHKTQIWILFAVMAGVILLFSKS